MASELKNTRMWKWIKLILWSMEGISVFIIFCIEMYVYLKSVKLKINEHKNVSKLQPHNTKKLYHLTNILPMISYLFYGLQGFFVILHITNALSCYIGGLIPLYIMGKSFMYLFYIYQLKIIYSQSMFNYNKRILVILFISIILYGICISISNALTLKASFIYINGIEYCKRTINGIILASGTVFDLIINIMCFILFIRPLKKLAKINEDTNYKIIKLLYKYAILTSVSVGTTFFTYIMVLFSDLEAIASIDIIINCLCLMMFNDYHHKMFNIICCCPVNILQKTIQPSHIETIDIDSNRQSSDNTGTFVSSTKISVVEGCIQSKDKDISLATVTPTNTVNQENNITKDDGLIQQEYMANQKDIWHLTKGHINPNEFQTSGNTTSNNGEASIYLSEIKG